MSVRRRKWTTKKGTHTAWLVDYTDQDGIRCFKQFEKKNDAVAHHETVKVDVRKGIHTSPNKSPTVSEAAANWIAHVEGEKRERSTIDHYRQHVKLHIEPHMGKERIAHLTTPSIEKFKDRLLADKMSRSMAKKVLVSLKSILRDAQRRGNLAHNPAIGVSIRIDKRDKRKIEAGVDFPIREEVKTILDAATGRMRALLTIAAFTGLRISEIRGLRWKDIDIGARKLHVRQKADAYNEETGSPKTKSSRRTVPFGQFVVSALNHRKMESAHRAPHDLVFPNSDGGIETYDHVKSDLDRIQAKCGVVAETGERDVAGKPKMAPKYAFHAFRHFFASWCASPPPAGRGLMPKVVQERMGHSSIMMTMDIYGHLFPSDDNPAEIDAAEQSLMA